MQACETNEQIRRVYAAVIAIAGASIRHHDIDDLAQKLWLKRHQQKGSDECFWRGKAFWQWVRFRVIDELRRAPKTVHLEDSPNQSSPLNSSRIRDEELGDALQDAIRQLTSEHQEVIQVAFFSNQDARPRREIAAELRLSHQTFESRLRRALEKLRQMTSIQDFWFEK
jgi:RNA polymerase sigma factor (sigma-70 family)